VCGGTTRFTYNEVDQVVTQTDARGNLRTNVYDKVGHTTPRATRSNATRWA
jgi:hypothetical protein